MHIMSGPVDQRRYFDHGTFEATADERLGTASGSLRAYVILMLNANLVSPSQHPGRNVAEIALSQLAVNEARLGRKHEHHAFSA